MFVFMIVFQHISLFSYRKNRIILNTNVIEQVSYVVKPKHQQTNSTLTTKFRKCSNLQTFHSHPCRLLRPHAEIHGNPVLLHVHGFIPQTFFPINLQLHLTNFNIFGSWGQIGHDWLVHFILKLPTPVFCR